jgi:hypothetical protein
MAVIVNMVVGDRVKRNQPGDYTHGREGVIVEFAKKDDRIRVKWDTWPDGTKMVTPIRTWVARKRLMLMVGGKPKLVGLPDCK